MVHPMAAQGMLTCEISVKMWAKGASGGALWALKEKEMLSGSVQLQETVKRKLEGARSPLNGDQQNGACDGSFSPTSKRLRKDIPTGMEAINSLPNNMPLPSASPLHQLDLKPSLPLQNSGSHTPGLLEDLSKNGRLPEIKLPVNGCSDLEDTFTILQSKDLKQEPLDDPTCIDTSETSLSNQNKLFSDINLNDQEWQELIDELANTVPEDDIQDLFNEDFEEKKEPEFSQPAAETPLSQESANLSQRMTPPMANPNKNPLMPYIQQQQQQQQPPPAAAATSTAAPGSQGTPERGPETHASHEAERSDESAHGLHCTSIPRTDPSVWVLRLLLRRLPLFRTLLSTHTCAAALGPHKHPAAIHTQAAATCVLSSEFFHCILPFLHVLFHSLGAAGSHVVTSCY
ncbi:Mastermind-like protein 3 [Tupaia chinensis]|uniref:Mastermind-like protein 3 n=1 Tax=Tupaia chinensis TaxID=246437 RepID=L9L2J7_TUPCH|nr:Mastermind-like protein 3 [Tupaia chinensis]